MIWAQLPLSKVVSNYSHFWQSKRTSAPSWIERRLSHLWSREMIYYLMTQIQISPEKMPSILASWVTNKDNLVQSKSMTNNIFLNWAKRSPLQELENFRLISRRLNAKGPLTLVQKMNSRNKLHLKNKWLPKILFLTLSQVKKQNYFSTPKESYFYSAMVRSLTKGKTNRTE